MTQTLTTERQQFEEWFNEEMLMRVTESNATAVRLMWKAWRASNARAANREAQPVAVTDEMALAFHRALNDGGIGEADLEEIKVGLRGALCNITAPPAPAVPDGVMPGGLVYSSALPKFESNDSDKIVGYRCFISGDTRIVESQEQAYADAKAVINACRAAMLAAAPEGGNGA